MLACSPAHVRLRMLCRRQCIRSATRRLCTRHYDVLGITSDALQAEVKGAYLRKAKAFHPDINKTPEAAQRFRQITDAYKVLRNPASRAAYDSGKREATTTREEATTREREKSRERKSWDAYEPGQTYASWKQELLRDFTRFSWHLIGVEDVGQYIRQMEAGFAKAVTAAAESPFERGSWEPARDWAIEYRGWVASGAVVCLLVTPVVPLAMLACVRLTRILDRHTEPLLAWCEAPWRAKAAAVRGRLRRELKTVRGWLGEDLGWLGRQWARARASK